jgi:hypothetical protein
MHALCVQIDFDEQTPSFLQNLLLQNHMSLRCCQFASRPDAPSRVDFSTSEVLPLIQRHFSSRSAMSRLYHQLARDNTYDGAVIHVLDQHLINITLHVLHVSICIHQYTLHIDKPDVSLASPVDSLM